MLSGRSSVLSFAQFTTSLVLAVALGAASPAFTGESGHDHDHDHAHEAKDDHDHDHDHRHEHRDHGAHEHGVADLAFAADGQKLVVEFLSPAANIVGFEHAPRTDEQKQALETATTLLKQADVQLTIDERAKCTLSDVTVTPPAFDDHGHDHDADHDSHADFSAAFTYECQAIDQLQSITVNLFESFPAIEKIKAVYLAENVQLGVDLTGKQSSITLP